jgi:hypothetical protein
MLTGKCKEDFEKWLVCGDGRCHFQKYYSDIEGNDNPYQWFTELTLSMQYGVYVDFFDSVGFYLTVRTFFEKYEWKVERIDSTLRKLEQHSENVESRNEARQKAIEKANEIYNQR